MKGFLSLPRAATVAYALAEWPVSEDNPLWQQFIFTVFTGEQRQPDQSGQIPGTGN